MRCTIILYQYTFRVIAWLLWTDVSAGTWAALSRVRERVAYLWVEWLGRSGRQLAQVLGIRPESVYKAARRGRQEAKSAVYEA
jgi:hypothetical protein